MDIDWNAVGDWFAGQTSTWVTLVCAIIVIVGLAKIGSGKRKRRNQDR